MTVLCQYRITSEALFQCWKFAFYASVFFKTGFPSATKHRDSELLNTISEESAEEKKKADSELPAGSWTALLYVSRGAEQRCLKNGWKLIHLFGLTWWKGAAKGVKRIETAGKG